MQKWNARSASSQADKFQAQNPKQNSPHVFFDYWSLELLWILNLEFHILANSRTGPSRHSSPVAVTNFCESLGKCTRSTFRRAASQIHQFQPARHLRGH